MVIAAFLLLAAGTTVLDRAEGLWVGPLRAAMRSHVFADAQSTAALLGVIAGGLVTITSITFSLVLLAVQQAASSLTFQVVDQFLRRRLNQVTFGFFVGLAIYALAVLATVAEPFNPVYGATTALLLSGVALYLLLLLLYTTLNQMRPAEIAEAIHDHTLAARQRQLALLRKTRRTPRVSQPDTIWIRGTRRGFVAHVDVDAIAAALPRAPGLAEVTLLVSIGSYVAYGDAIASVTGAVDDREAVEDAVHGAVRLERQRNLAFDPAYGVEQLATIAWTSISTSKSDPAPGLLVIHSLRDVLARWAAEGVEEKGSPGGADEPDVAVVYSDDVLPQLMDAFESLAVVSSESMQHQAFAEITRTFATMFDRLPTDLQRRAEELVRRILPALGDHVLTADLDAALSSLTSSLAAAGKRETAAALQAAHAGLAGTVGKLNSRSTRVPSGA